MVKFDFSILTRDGQRIESIVITAPSEADAERRLRQMYRYCEIVSCNSKDSDGVRPGQAVSVEDILTMISK